MKAEEHTDNDKESYLDEETDSLDDKINSNSLGFVDDGDDLPDVKRNFAGEGKDEGEDDVEKEQHEEFSVAKSYTIGYPGTVVVHVEYAALASRAVVTSNSYHNYLSGLKL